jgi:DNA-binding response OmpR family regulator
VVDRPRVLVVLPDSLEAGAVVARLSADGHETVRRPTPEAATAEMRTRAFDVLIADAALAFRSGLHIQARARNPLTATILIGDVASSRPGDAATGQIMYLARPLDCTIIACFHP